MTNEKKIVDPVGPKERGVMVFPRDQLLTALLSIYCPGAGQVYNGQPGKGLIFLFTFWLVIPWIWSIVDAYRVAGKINQRLLPNIGTSLHVLLFFLIPVFVGLLIALAFVSGLVQMVQ
ncbi:NINE protein [Bdellovibrionota bacterium]